jgi:hypothetical protein
MDLTKLTEEQRIQYEKDVQLSDSLLSLNDFYTNSLAYDIRNITLLQSVSNSHSEELKTSIDYNLLRKKGIEALEKHIQELNKKYSDQIIEEEPIYDIEPITDEDLAIATQNGWFIKEDGELRYTIEKNNAVYSIMKNIPKIEFNNITKII